MCVCVCDIYKNNSYKNLFFLFYDTFTAKLNGNAMTKKKAISFQLESLVDKITFNFHLFNKINNFVTSQYATTVFYPLYLNPYS